MIAGTLGGFVYFNELEEMDALSKAMFIGALISVAGIVILSTRRQPGDGAEGDDTYGRVGKGWERRWWRMRMEIVLRMKTSLR